MQFSFRRRAISDGNSVKIAKPIEWSSESGCGKVGFLELCPLGEMVTGTDEKE